MASDKRRFIMVVSHMECYRIVKHPRTLGYFSKKLFSDMAYLQQGQKYGKKKKQIESTYLLAVENLSNKERKHKTLQNIAVGNIHPPQFIFASRFVILIYFLLNPW